MDSSNIPEQVVHQPRRKQRRRVQSNHARGMLGPTQSAQASATRVVTIPAPSNIRISTAREAGARGELSGGFDLSMRVGSRAPPADATTTTRATATAQPPAAHRPPVRQPPARPKPPMLGPFDTAVQPQAPEHGGSVDRYIHVTTRGGRVSTREWTQPHLPRVRQPLPLPDIAEEHEQENAEDLPAPTDNCDDHDQFDRRSKSPPNVGISDGWGDVWDIDEDEEVLAPEELLDENGEEKETGSGRKSYMTS
ncbi:hypothetical protein CYLTODRAFT_495487, partial [Cylindrobasidium torrendii FP15055 ss-10]